MLKQLGLHVNKGQLAQPGKGGGSGGELKTEECIDIGVGPRVILRVGHSVGRGFGGRWYW